MPKYRIITTLGLALAIPLWAWAQDPSPIEALPGSDAPAATKSAAIEAPPTAAETLIDEAVRKLGDVQSVSADMDVSADMINQKFGLKGQYIKAPGHRLYLLLTLVGLGDTSGTMLQVCDGATLWDFTKVLGSQQCARMGFTQILKVLERPECDPEFRETILDQLGFAGPEALLTGLRKAFTFDQTLEDTIDGKAVWILVGTWKEGTTPVLPSGAGLPPGAPLPPYIPSLAYLSIGKEDGWPYKLVLEGRKPAQIETGVRKKSEEVKLDPSGRPISKRLTAPIGQPSKIILVYSNVKLNEPIADDTFAFSPPADVKPEDRTDQMVSQLEQIITNRANEKRAEAAKAAGPVLDGGLSAPTVPSGNDASAPPR